MQIIRDYIRKTKKNIRVKLRTNYLFWNRKKRAAILIGSPEHGNLGDHAIALAEINFLKTNFPDLQVIEVSGSHFRKDPMGVKAKVSDKDIIFITGGGFLGDLWMIEEEMVRSIINSFPNNPIIIFPQTIFFSSTESGLQEKAASKACYEKHTNLSICLRDKNSYAFISQEFPNITNHLLVPDMVTYFNLSYPVKQRNDVLLCMRMDKEKTVSNDQLQSIKTVLTRHGLKYSYTSTVLEHHIGFSSRQYELEKKIDEFKRSRIVITDRLHGMLFAAITGTPCIALNNISGKVEGVLEWIKYLKYVKFTGDASEIEELLKEILNEEKESYQYDNTPLEPYFDMIKSEIIDKIKKHATDI